MPPRSGTRVVTFAFLAVLLAVVGSISYVGWRQSVAGVSASGTPPRLLGQTTALPLVLEAARGNVVLAEVRVVQGTQATVAVRREGTLGRRVELPVTIDGARLGLREGAATVEVWARDDFWRPLRFDDRPVATYPVTVDLTPPRLEILGATRYMAQGGAGIAAFRVSGAAGVTVAAGELTFPSFPLPGAEPEARVALLGLPHDFVPGTGIVVTARDEAGNTTTRGLPIEVRTRRFPQDRIVLRDSFLQAKVPELLPQAAADQPLIERFLVINRRLREEAEAEKRRVGALTADRALWSGAFMHPRNVKVFANFAESRTYVYEGQEVDRQIHFGIDLASTRQAPAPAANGGTVVFAGPLSIYGETVIIDHGLGLQSLYSHLSRRAVEVGDVVERGQEIGRTGTSGLAIGDHLHLEVLVHGVSVTPIEWWDARWVRDHIAAPLEAAGLPDITGLRAGTDAPRAAASR